MEIRPAMRVIEVGNILYSPALQRTPLGTEAQFLLARYAFEALGYRRVAVLAGPVGELPERERAQVRPALEAPWEAGALPALEGRAQQPLEDNLWACDLPRVHLGLRGSAGLEQEGPGRARSAE